MLRRPAWWRRSRLGWWRRPAWKQRLDGNAGEKMSYQVTVTDSVARPTAVVLATTTWQEFPVLWRKLSLVGGLWPSQRRSGQGVDRDLLFAARTACFPDGGCRRS